MNKIEGIIGIDGLLHCSKCADRIEKEIDFPNMDGNRGFHKRKVRVACKCRIEEEKAMDAKLQYEADMRMINELRKLSLMDAKLKDIFFSRYKVTKENEKVFNFAKNYVDNFEEMFTNSQGILFYGDVGTGKSYTAAAIANELLIKKQSVVMTSFIKLLQNIGSFETGDGAYIDKLNLAKLLVIDDLGAERSTDFALEKVYNIVDSRSRSGKPVIFTSNLDLAVMKNCDDIRYNRIYDRIFEMCFPMKMEGLSWRKKEAVRRFESMKAILEG